MAPVGPQRHRRNKDEVTSMPSLHAKPSIGMKQWIYIYAFLTSTLRDKLAAPAALIQRKFLPSPPLSLKQEITMYQSSFP